MVEALDKEASKLGIQREAIITSFWLAERLEEKSCRCCSLTLLKSILLTNFLPWQPLSDILDEDLAVRPGGRSLLRPGESTTLEQGAGGDLAQ